MKVFIGPYKDDDSERQIDIHIDPYDTWSMDHTLAVIILPMLRQLKQTQHGAPVVEDSDVPDELKSTSAPPKENEWDVDQNHFKRWDWVMDEMIFAFEAHNDDNWDSQFYSGEADYLFQPCDENGSPIGEPVKLGDTDPDVSYEYSTMVHGPNHTLVHDIESHKKMDDRIANGFRLFGKYYRSLWD